MVSHLNENEQKIISEELASHDIIVYYIGAKKILGTASGGRPDRLVWDYDGEEVNPNLYCDGKGFDNSSPYIEYTDAHKCWYDGWGNIQRKVICEERFDCNPSTRGSG